MYDIPLSDVKEHTVRMIVFPLLIPPFHTPMQSPNEGNRIQQFHSIQSTLLFNMNTNEGIQ